MRLRSAPKVRAAELMPKQTHAEMHQAAILSEFQRAAAARERAAKLLNAAHEMDGEATAAYDEARKRLRRVSEGAI